MKRLALISASLLLCVADLSQAAEIGCNCAIRKGWCSGGAQVAGALIKFTSNTRQCSQITYHLGGQSATVTIKNASGTADLKSDAVPVVDFCTVCAAGNQTPAEIPVHAVPESDDVSTETPPDNAASTTADMGGKDTTARNALVAAPSVGVPAADINDGGEAPGQSYVAPGASADAGDRSNDADTGGLGQLQAEGAADEPASADVGDGDKTVDQLKALAAPTEDIIRAARARHERVAAAKAEKRRQQEARKTEERRRQLARQQAYARAAAAAHPPVYTQPARSYPSVNTSGEGEAFIGALVSGLTGVATARLNRPVYPLPPAPVVHFAAPAPARTIAPVYQPSKGSSFSVPDHCPGAMVVHDPITCKALH